MKSQIFPALAVVAALLISPSVVAQDNEDLSFQANRRGAQLYRQGKYEEAIKEFEMACKLSRDRYSRAVTLSNIGSSYSSLKNHRKAEEACNEAIQMHPEVPQAYNNRAMARRVLGNFNGALDDCRIALGLTHDDYPEALLNLADTLADLGRNRQAIKVYKSITQSYPNFNLAWANLGLAYQRIDLSRDAIDCCERAIELNPTNSIAVANLASALAATGRFKDALVRIDKAIAMSPNNSSHRIVKAEILRQHGDDAQAIRVLQEIDRPSIAAKQELAWILATSSGSDRDVQEALRHAKSVFRARFLAAHHKIDQNRVLAAVFASDGQFDTAVKRIDDALDIANQGEFSEELRRKLVAEKKLYSQNRPLRI